MFGELQLLKTLKFWKPRNEKEKCRFPASLLRSAERQERLKGTHSSVSLIRRKSSCSTTAPDISVCNGDERRFTTTGRGRSVQKTAFGRTHCDTAVSADQASRPLKRRDPELYLQAVSMDLDPSDHAFFKGRQHVQNGAESAASERHKRINKMRTSTTGREMNHPPLSALCTDQAPCCPPGRCRTPRRPRPQGAPRHAACRGLRVTPLLFPRRTLCCPPG